MQLLSIGAVETKHKGNKYNMNVLAFNRLPMIIMNLNHNLSWY